MIPTTWYWDPNLGWIPRAVPNTPRGLPPSPWTSGGQPIRMAPTWGGPGGGWDPFGVLPPGFTEGNRFGGGAPIFTPPGFSGPQWTPGGSIFGGRAGPNSFLPGTPSIFGLPGGGPSPFSYGMNRALLLARIFAQRYGPEILLPYSDIAGGDLGEAGGGRHMGSGRAPTTIRHLGGVIGLPSFHTGGQVPGVRGPAIHIYAFTDPNEMVRHMAGREGQKIIFDTVKGRRIDLGI